MPCKTDTLLKGSRRAHPSPTAQKKPSLNLSWYLSIKQAYLLAAGNYPQLLRLKRSLNGILTTPILVCSFFTPMKLFVLQ